MNESLITNLLIVGLMFEVIWAAWAFTRIRRIYVEEKGWRSKLFRALIWMDGLAVLVGLMFLPITVIAVFGLPRLPFTGIIVTVGVMLLLSAVIVHHHVFERTKREKGRLSPPERPPLRPKVRR